MNGSKNYAQHNDNRNKIERPTNRVGPIALHYPPTTVNVTNFNWLCLCLSDPM